MAAGARSMNRLSRSSVARSATVRCSTLRVSCSRDRRSDQAAPPSSSDASKATSRSVSIAWRQGRRTSASDTLLLTTTPQPWSMRHAPTRRTPSIRELPITPPSGSVVHVAATRCSLAGSGGGTNGSQDRAMVAPSVRNRAIRCVAVAPITSCQYCRRSASLTAIRMRPSNTPLRNRGFTMLNTGIPSTMPTTARSTKYWPAPIVLAAVKYSRVLRSR